MKTIKLSFVLLLISINSFANYGTPTKDRAPTVILQEVIIDAPIERAWEVLGSQFENAQVWA